MNGKFAHVLSISAWRATPTNMTVRDVKVREVIRLLENDGWLHVRTSGSHRQFRHAIKPGTVTVAGNSGTDVPAGTLGSILKRAGLKKR